MINWENFVPAILLKHKTKDASIFPKHKYKVFVFKYLGKIKSINKY